MGRGTWDASASNAWPGGRGGACRSPQAGKAGRCPPGRRPTRGGALRSRSCSCGGHQCLDSRKRLCCSELACFGGLSGLSGQSRALGAGAAGPPGPGVCQWPGHSMWDGRGPGPAGRADGGSRHPRREAGGCFPTSGPCWGGRGNTLRRTVSASLGGACPVFEVSGGPCTGLSGRRVFVSTAVGTGLPCVTLEPGKGYRTATAQFTSSEERKGRRSSLASNVTA